jgi:hypothetical protein
MDNETCKECSTIGGCPFSFTDESEKIQNYGCLPSPMDIIQMRVLFGKTWACHSNPTKPCLGALEYLRKKKLEFKVIDKVLLTEKSDWDKYCPPNPEFIRRIQKLEYADFQDFTSKVL